MATKRGKRRVEQAEERTSNVIPLHAPRTEVQPTDARLSERSAENPGSSVERPIRGDNTQEDDGLPPDLSIPPPAPAAFAAVKEPEPHGRDERDEKDEHEQHDDDAKAFFMSAPPKSIAPSGEPWADFDAEPVHPPTHRGAMLWTAWIAGVGLFLIGAFLLYNKVLMPTPEEFTARGPIALPTPDMVKVKPSEPVPDPEPAAIEPAPVETAEPAPAEPAPAPSIAEPAPGADAQSLISEARKLGFRPRAEELLLKATEVAPSSAEAFSGLALFYLNQGKNAQAKQRAEQAIALDDKNDEAWIVLGAAEGALGHSKAAREAYMRCAALPSGKHVAECKRLVR